MFTKNENEAKTLSCDELEKCVKELEQTVKTNTLKLEEAKPKENLFSIASIFKLSGFKNNTKEDEEEKKANKNIDKIIAEIKELEENGVWSRLDRNMTLIDDKEDSSGRSLCFEI